MAQCPELLRGGTFFHQIAVRRIVLSAFSAGYESPESLRRRNTRSPKAHRSLRNEAGDIVDCRGRYTIGIGRVCQVNRVVAVSIGRQAEPVFLEISDPTRMAAIVVTENSHINLIQISALCIVTDVKAGRSKDAVNRLGIVENIIQAGFDAIFAAGMAV